MSRRRAGRLFMVAFLLAPPLAALAAHPECRCRAHGQTYDQDSVVRLHGSVCARCTMSSNVPTWEILSDGCPTA